MENSIAWLEYRKDSHMKRFLPFLLLLAPAFAATIDLHDAVVVVRAGTLPNAEKSAAVVLVEEIEKRTGIHLQTSTQWPSNKPAIEVTSIGSSVTKPEGYHLFVDPAHPNTVRIMGADSRGVLYGVGNFLRLANLGKGVISIDSPLDIATAPHDSIRGHQLGYRTQANTYDAWTPQQFDQYIRELTFFGANSIEGIPFQDLRPTPVMKYSRREMNRAIGESCYRYGIDYWAWIPADFDLNDKTKRAQLLAQSAEFFKDTPEFTGVFFPEEIPARILPNSSCRSWKTCPKSCSPCIPKPKSGSPCRCFPSSSRISCISTSNANPRSGWEVW